MKPLALVKPLIATRSALDSLIEDFEAGVSGSEADFLELGRTRENIKRAINAVVQAAFKPDADLEVAVAAVEAANAQLDATADLQEKVKLGIDVGGKVLGAVAKVVALVLA